MGHSVRMKAILLSAILMSTGLGATSCGKDSPPSASCAVVADLTGSPGVDWTTEQINGGLNSLRQDCFGGTAGIGLIVARSISSQCPKTQTPTTAATEGSSSGKTEADNDTWNTYIANVNALLACGAGAVNPANERGSDVIGGIQGGAEQLQKSPAGDKNLIIVSDMVHSKPELNLQTTLTDVPGAVEGVASKGLVPNLDGVDVKVVGLGVNSQKLTNEDLTRIREFWDLYFQKAGASSVTFIPSL